MKLKNYDKVKKAKAIKEAARAAKIHETNNEEDFYIPTIIENNNNSSSSSNEGSGGNQYKKLPSALEDIDEDELERAAMQASIAAHMKQPSSSTEGVGSVGESVRTTLRRSSIDLMKKVENVASRVDQARQTITRTLAGGDDYSKFDNYGGNDFSIDGNGNIFIDPTEERKKKIKLVIRFTLILLIIFLVTKMILWTKSVDDQYSHIPYAPIGLKDMCSPMLLSAGDSDLCKKYCQPAMCCWSPYKKNKCSAESNRMADVCSGYETYCQTLSYNLGDEASSYYMNPSATAAEANNKNQIIDSAPIDLAQECALTPSGSLIHHQACLAACQPASCCFEISPALSCLEANPEQCEDYKRGGCIYLPAKGFLTDHTSSLPPKPSSLEYTCSLQSISKAEEMHDLCVTLCEPALCCIGLGNVRNCAAEKDSAEQLCKEYSPHCKNVWPYSTEIAVNNPGSTQHFEIPSPLYAVCSMQEHANPDLCDSACDLGSCCWNKDPDQNCEKDYAQICAEYHSCPHYKMNAPDFYHTGTALNDDFIDDDSSLSVKMPEVSMDILCSISNLLSDEGLSKCRRECEKAKCCFASSHNSCLDNFSATCDLYAPCSSLPPDFSSSSTNNNDKQSSNSSEKNNIPPPQPVDELCSEGNLRTKKGRDLCSQICEAGMCCFEQASDENCFLDNPSRCREYDACRAMYQVPEPQGDIESKCEPLLSSDFSYNIKNNADLSLADSQKLCKDACKPASCCWEPEPGNCYQQNAATCQKYEVCSMVDDSSSSLSVWSDGFDTSTVTQLCSTENKRSKQGLEQCQKACSVASCCVNNNNEEEEWMEGTSSSGCGDEFCSFYVEQCEDVLIHTADNNKDSALLPTTPSSSQNNVEISNESSLDSVQIVCSEEGVNRTPDGRQKCKDECSMVTCCVVPSSSPYSCVEQNPYYCSTHVDACEILTAQYQEEEEEDSSPYYDTGLPYAPPELEDRFCTDSNIRTFSGRSKCEEMCAVSSCCFAFSTGDQASSFSCYEENQEACDTYSVCVKLRDFNY